MNLQTSLTFLYTSELRDVALKLSLPVTGRKIELIQRILHFHNTCEILHSPKIPDISKATKGTRYTLAPNTLILKKSYKNDLPTRLFFKKIIGEYFHFTAFGIDWINERWLAGNPPTYQEFADMWKAEYARRITNPPAPKEEWAYINFVQKYGDASRDEIVRAWNEERARHAKIVKRLFNL